MKASDVLPAERQPWHTDYRRMIHRVQPQQLSSEMLVRASRFRHLQAEVSGADEPPGLLAIDATAGMGEDSMLLAAAGYTVELYEKNPVTAAMLRENLQQAAVYPELAPILSRMHVHEGDAIEAMYHWSDRAPDLVYLDPMFPARTKSGKVKRKLQVLQQLEAPEDAAQQTKLLEAALSVSPRRIVIKRPANGPYLAARKPAYSIRGKVIRYDVLVIHA